MDLLHLEHLARIEKKQIIDHDSGPSLVIAGPGAGKTTTLADKVIDLCQNHDSNKIYAITFTNLAAEELHKKVIRQCSKYGQEVPEPNISTLHALAKKLLHRFHENVALPSSFRVMGNVQESYLLADVRTDLKKSKANLGKSQKRYLRRAQAEQAFILKEHFDRLPAIPETAHSASQEQFNKSYNTLLRYYRSLDWYDVVALAVKLLRENEDVQEEICSDIEFLLVDEYQDLNRADQVLIHFLSKEAKALFVFGDDDQSIYETMRFANPSGIIKFKDCYPGAKIYPMSICWRCGSAILDAAWKLIDVDERLLPERMRKPKPIPNPIRGTGNICVGSFGSPREEIEKIAGVLRKCTIDDKRPRKIRLLFHSKELGHEYVKKLEEQGLSIENRIIKKASENAGMILLFETLNLIKDGSNNFAVRVLLEKLFDFRQIEIARLRMQSTLKNTSLWEEVNAEMPAPGRILDFVGYIANWRKMEHPIEILTQVVEFLGIESNPEVQEIVKNWRSLENVTLEKVRLHLERGIEINDDEEVSDDKEEAKTTIVAMTMHGAKGLEGDIVFIPALEDEFIPDDSYEPEMRRLMYMSMTRAEESLLLSHSWSRKGRLTYRAKDHRTIKRVRSRFIDELDIT